MESTTYSKTDFKDVNKSLTTPENSKYASIFNSLCLNQKPSNISRIGFAFNARPSEDTPESDSVTLEYDEIETITAIQKALENVGFEVILLEADESFAERVKASKVEFVFNIAEGKKGESRESHIPAILEMLGIPYSGSGILAQALTLSKTRTKEILDYYKIPTARYQKFYTLNDKLSSKLHFPLIVKPDAEGSSVGITNSSVVHNEKELRNQIGQILNNFRAPVLVEEFCPGTEFTVGILGNNPPVVLPIIQVNFVHLPSWFEKIDSYESKWIFDNADGSVNPLICPAPIKPKLQKQIEEIALKAFEVLGCTDLCRMDIRLDRKGNPMILEVNALPGLNPNPNFHSRFPYACQAAGLKYDEMIVAITNAALKRYGFC